jgi:DNA invertase Pin-like site-specific DNA recombinase
VRGKFIAYYRVSTAEQGKSGLGLEAQRKAVRDYLDGGSWELIGEYTEVETGKRSDRPELEKAIAACKKHRARLVIAKLDRLSRNVAFIATLLEKKIDFLCCDNPHATKFNLHILAAVAEFERDAISKRTTEALAAAKARGVKLGNISALPEPNRKPPRPAPRPCGRPLRQPPICRPLPPPPPSTAAASPQQTARAGRPRRSSARAGAWASPPKPPDRAARGPGVRFPGVSRSP